MAFGLNYIDFTTARVKAVRVRGYRVHTVFYTRLVIIMHIPARLLLTDAKTHRSGERIAAQRADIEERRHVDVCSFSMAAGDDVYCSVRDICVCRQLLQMRDCCRVSQKPHTNTRKL